MDTDSWISPTLLTVFLTTFSLKLLNFLIFGIYLCCFTQPERLKGAKDQVNRPKGLRLDVRALRAFRLLVYSIVVVQSDCGDGLDEKAKSKWTSITMMMMMMMTTKPLALLSTLEVWLAATIPIRALQVEDYIIKEILQVEDYIIKEIHIVIIIIVLIIITIIIFIIFIKMMPHLLLTNR